MLFVFCEIITLDIFRLNSSTTINVHDEQLDSDNALEILESYDIILDATDNVATRYLLNDACVLLNKPLVSGSAIKVLSSFKM